MAKRRNYQDLGDELLPAEVAAKVSKMVQEADAEVEEARVNFRWGREQVSLVKRAAHLMGIPYQTYIKQVVYRQAVRDLKESTSL